MSDSQNRRTHHIAGEEILGPGDRDPWASVDLEAVGRIAQGGVEPLVAFLVSPSADATPRAPVPVSDDFTPEASGIFRVFRSVWPKSENKKPPEEPPARTPGASTVRPERPVVGTDHPTVSSVPAELQ